MAKEKTSRVTKIKPNSVKPTKQSDDASKVLYLDPPISFDSLVTAYENSFMIGGIMERIGTTANI